MNKKILGIVGYPLGHSFSKNYFNSYFEEEGLNYEYRNFELKDITEFPQLINREPNLVGVNVTIPYKQSVIQFLNYVDSTAKEVGAVNCITIKHQSNGEIFTSGYNTDIYGFELSLLELIGDARPEALVLGTGGASKAVVWVLNKLGINYKIVSRTITANHLSYNDLNCDIIKDKLIINTTPLGMYPHTDNCASIPYEEIDNGNYMYDLVYNPSPTLFLEKGKKQGAKIMGGSKMLILQAQKAWEYFSEIQ